MLEREEAWNFIEATINSDSEHTGTVVVLTSVSQPPSRGPVPGPGISYIGPR